MRQPSRRKCGRPCAIFSTGSRKRDSTFANVVATNVYLDDINDFAKMNKVYAEYFSSTPPTRTTVQQYPGFAGA